MHTSVCVTPRVPSPVAAGVFCWLRAPHWKPSKAGLHQARAARNTNAPGLLTERFENQGRSYASLVTCAHAVPVI